MYSRFRFYFLFRLYITYITHFKGSYSRLLLIKKLRSNKHTLMWPTDSTVAAWFHHLLEFTPLWDPLPFSAVGTCDVLVNKKYSTGDGCHAGDDITLQKTVLLAGCLDYSFWLEVKWPCCGSPPGKELLVASKSWKQPPANTKQEAMALSPTNTRKWILSTI